MADKTDGRNREAKTQYKTIKMVNKKYATLGTGLNMTLMSTLIVPILATCSPHLGRYLIHDTILGGLYKVKFHYLNAMLGYGRVEV